MKQYYKIENGKTIFYQGQSIILGEWRISNPTEEQLLEAGWMIYETQEPEEPSQEELLQDAKQAKLLELQEYDSSSSVNSIIVNDLELWIPAEQRAILKTSVDAYKSLNYDSVTKVWEGLEYTASPDQWLTMINMVEVYASECFNTTARHKAAIEALTTVEEVENYDFTINYPNKLNFNL